MRFLTHLMRRLLQQRYPPGALKDNKSSVLVLCMPLLAIFSVCIFLPAPARQRAHNSDILKGVWNLLIVDAWVLARATSLWNLGEQQIAASDAKCLWISQQLLLLICLDYIAHASFRNGKECHGFLDSWHNGSWKSGISVESWEKINCRVWCAVPVICNPSSPLCAYLNLWAPFGNIKVRLNSGVASLCGSSIVTGSFRNR